MGGIHADAPPTPQVFPEALPPLPLYPPAPPLAVLPLPHTPLGRTQSSPSSVKPPPPDGPPQHLFTTGMGPWGGGCVPRGGPMGFPYVYRVPPFSLLPVLPWGVTVSRGVNPYPVGFPSPGGPMGQPYTL